MRNATGYNYLKELHRAEISILRAVVGICDKFNLTYYILGGTLLGAIRHKGFIPWDDDIDIGLPRRDYEKFCKIAAKELRGNMKLNTYQTVDSFLDYIPKVVDTSIVLKDRSASIVQQQYAWIDVFPLDGMPNNQIKLKIHSFRLLLARMIFNYSIFSSGVDMNAKNRPWYEKVLIRFGQVLPVEKIFNRQKAYIRLDRLLKMYDFDESNYLINLMGAYKLKEMFHKKYFGNGAKYEFEGMQLNGPKDYNYVLTQLYGDYMTPPPIGDRNHHRIEIVK